MISKANYYGVLGHVHVLIKRRQQLGEWEGLATEFLKGLGGKDGDDQPYSMKIKDFVGEAVYNSGDDPEAAAAELLEAVGLEVEDA